eukprot:sb/3467152/
MNTDYTLQDREMETTEPGFFPPNRTEPNLKNLFTEPNRTEFPNCKCKFTNRQNFENFPKKNRGKEILPVNRGSGKSGPGKSGSDCTSLTPPVYKCKGRFEHDNFFSASTLIEESNISLRKFALCDNIDLETVLQTLEMPVVILAVDPKTPPNTTTTRNKQNVVLFAGKQGRTRQTKCTCSIPHNIPGYPIPGNPHYLHVRILYPRTFSGNTLEMPVVIVAVDPKTPPNTATTRNKQTTKCTCRYSILTFTTFIYLYYKVQMSGVMVMDDPIKLKLVAFERKSMAKKTLVLKYGPVLAFIQCSFWRKK